MKVLALLLLGTFLLSACQPSGAPSSGIDLSLSEPSREKGKTGLGLPDGRRLTVDVVDEPLTRQRGLMFRAKLAKDYGMLFVFPREGEYPFWMKNTWVSLDIVYIGADKRITAVRERVNASPADAPDAAVARVTGHGLYVLELPAGDAARYGLKMGDALDFDVPIPSR